MAKAAKLAVTVRVRWWVKPYLHIMLAIAYQLDMQPDVEKVAQFVAKYGMYIQPVSIKIHG